MIIILLCKLIANFAESAVGGLHVLAAGAWLADNGWHAFLKQ